MRFACNHRLSANGYAHGCGNCEHYDGMLIWDAVSEQQKIIQIIFVRALAL